MIWLTVTKYSYLKWQWIFYFLSRFFLSSITAKVFIYIKITILVTWRVFYKKQELLTYREHLGSSPVFGGVVLVFGVVFFVLCIFVLCLVYPMLPSSLDCPFLICHSVFSNVYLVLCFVYPMLPSSLDCPFLICHFVFSIIYLTNVKSFKLEW